jgi:GT2 family glycosyltransferase
VLVLENGSPDGEAVDEALIAGRAELIVSDTNLGFAAGNNRLAEGIDQDWIFLLNPDAFPEPDLIEQLVAATERYPQAALFGCTQMADGAPGVLDGAWAMSITSPACPIAAGMDGASRRRLMANVFAPLRRGDLDPAGRV